MDGFSISLYIILPFSHFCINGVPKSSILFGTQRDRKAKCNVLNPKVTIFFVAFFPGFLFSETMSTIAQFYILGGIFMLVSFIIFSAIALLAGQIKSYTLKHKNSGVVFKWLQIVVFIGIAVFILV